MVKLLITIKEVNTATVIWPYLIRLSTFSADMPVLKRVDLIRIVSSNMIHACIIPAHSLNTG